MIHLSWGHRGARDAAARDHVTAVVDVLSFCTTVATAAHHGIAIHACSKTEDPTPIAQRAGATVALRREEGIRAGRFTLSPLSFIDAQPGQAVVLPSPNGSTCTRLAGHTRALYAGALVNASATARALQKAAEGTTDITVVACGERWPDDGSLRVALEDYLGAGAIIAGLTGEMTPDAQACAITFERVRSEGRLGDFIRDCPSGQELVERGFAGDVEHAARLDIYDTAALFSGGCFTTQTFR